MAKWRVKELARAKGFTAEELSIQSGVKMSTVKNLWQNRVNDPGYFTLKPIAGVLGVSVEDLEDIEETTEKNRAPAGFGIASATA